LHDLQTGQVQVVCTCRRHLRHRLATRHCPIHGRKRGQPVAHANAGRASLSWPEPFGQRRMARRSAPPSRSV
jgi:hypothetical protein